MEAGLEGGIFWSGGFEIERPLLPESFLSAFFFALDCFALLWLGSVQEESRRGERGEGSDESRRKEKRGKKVLKLSSFLFFSFLLSIYFFFGYDTTCFDSIFWRYSTSALI